MTRFIIRRLLSSIPVLIGIVVLVFVLVRVIPGEPCTAAFGEKATPQVCAAFTTRYGLDKPLPEQFVIYAGSLVQGDFGSSIRYGRPVSEILMERLPVTVELTVLALLFASTVGITLGLVSATRRNSPVDAGTMIIANLGVSTPVFVLGLLLAFVFAVMLKNTPLALPPSGRLTPGVDVVPLATVWGLTGLTGPLRGVLDFISNMYLVNGLLTLNFSLFFDALRHLILPAVAVGTIPLAIIARMTRSSLLDVVTGGDYGFKELCGVAIEGDALYVADTWNGRIQGYTLAGLLRASVGELYNLTGMGKTLFESIQGRDYIVIQGVTVVVALIYLVVNLIVDVSYAFLDPRIRLS